jgi:hypothetical protein
MTKLIGKGPAQVPTNSDLGTMAFVDHLGIGDIRVRSLNYEPSDTNRFSYSNADTGVINIKSHDNTRAGGIYLERYNERKGYSIYPTSGGLGGNDTLNFDRNNNGTKGTTMALDRDGNAHFGNDVTVAGDLKSTQECQIQTIVSDTWSTPAQSVGRHVINLNTRTGASTGNTGFWRVCVSGYSTAGANACNMMYTVGGFAGHSYSVYNYNSIGAGTIQNGYQSSNSTNYQTLGHSYHPCINNNAYIVNGQIWVYVPGAQQYGFAVVNDANQSIGGTITVEHIQV